MPQWILNNHENRTKVETDIGSLHAAIRAAKDLWPTCLVLVHEGLTVVSSAICVYLDEEDMADRKAVGEITIE